MIQDDGWKLTAEIDLGKRLAKKGVEIPGELVVFKLTSGTVARRRRDPLRLRLYRKVVIRTCASR